MKNVIILGGTGFIGSHTVEQFWLAGYEVTVVVRPSSNCKSIEQYCHHIIRLDFDKQDDLVKVFEGHSLLVNCIAYVSTHNTLAQLIKVQVELIGKITNAAIKAKIKRYFLLSTVEAYGFEGNPTKTESSPYLPSHNFQHSFVAKEKYFLDLVKSSTMEYIILQPASTIGKREINSSFFLPLYEMQQKGLSILINGGKAKVSLVDTRDIGRAFVHFAENPAIKNEIFLQKAYDSSWYELKKMMDLYTNKIAKEINLSSKIAKPLSKIAALLTPKGKEPALPPLAVDLFSKDVIIDDAKLINTGFQPKYTLADSVEDAILFFQSSKEKSNHELYEWKRKGSYFQYKQDQIFYRVTPNMDKKCIVFLHGFPSSSFDYKFIWDHLEQDFTLIAFDFLGFGFSDKPHKPYSVFEQVDILKALLETLDLNSINLVAHNYGTIVAQELLAQFNEHNLSFGIDKLILLNGSVFPELYQPTSTQKLLTSPLGGFFSKLFGNNKQYFGKKLGAIFGKQTKPSKKQIDDFWQLNKYNNGNFIAHKILSYIKEREQNAQRWVNALEQTKVKTKMINGIDDPVSGLQILDMYLKRVSQGSGVKLPNIGHYPQLEDAERVLEEVHSFMS